MQLQHEFAACKSLHHQALIVWTFASSRYREPFFCKMRPNCATQESNCEICYNLSACPVSCAPLDALLGHKSQVMGNQLDRLVARQHGTGKCEKCLDMGKAFARHVTSRDKSSGLQRAHHDLKPRGDCTSSKLWLHETKFASIVMRQWKH